MQPLFVCFTNKFGPESAGELSPQLPIDIAPPFQLKKKSRLYFIIIYYSWNGGRAEAVCAGGKGVRLRCILLSGRRPKLDRTFFTSSLQKTAESSPGGLDQIRFVFAIEQTNHSFSHNNKS
jgi:hypothetical protein